MKSLMSLVLGAIIAATAMGAAPASAEAAELPSPARPNIVMLLLDDISPHDGRLWDRLPTIRKTFIEQGVEFTDFHGETPTCCPGRVGFLTGLHTDAHRVRWNDARLFSPGMTIATQLRRAGYYTIYGGKYLNGIELIRDKHPPGWSQFHGMSGDYYRYRMYSNGVSNYYGNDPSDYSTDVISRKVMKSLKNAPDGKRVFVTIAPWAAHVPRTPARRHRDDARCTGIEKWKPPNYMERWVGDKPAYIRKRKRVRPDGFNLGSTCRSLLSVDQTLAKVIAELKNQGRYNNTMFILTADNGMNLGAHRFLEDKKTPFATQLPFFVTWPKGLGTSSRQITERVQNIDVAPTLCKLAGCRLGPYPTGQRAPDGKQFAGLLLGTTNKIKRGAILSSFQTRGAAKVPRWYAVTTTRHSGFANRRCASAASGGCLWTYVEYETGEKELYDLSNGPCWEWSRGQPGDPCRLENKAGKNAYRGIQSDLRLKLRNMKSRAPR